MKKRYKVISIAVGSLLVLIVAALLLLTGSPGEDFIRGWLESRLSEEIGLPVTIAKFETNLWSRVQVDTLVVGAGDGPEGSPVLYIGQVQVGYSLPELLGGTVTFKRIAVDSVYAGVTRDSAGQYGIPMLDNPSEPDDQSDQAPTDFRIDTLSLRSISLLYLDPQVPLTVELLGAVISGGTDSLGNNSARISAAGITAAYDRTSVDLVDVDVSASMDRESVYLEKMRVSGEGLHLEAQGEIGLSDSAGTSLGMSVYGTLDILLSSLGPAFDLPAVRGGQLSSRCRVEGTLDDPSIEVAADLVDLTVSETVIDSISVRARYHDTRVSVDTLRLATMNGNITGGGSAVLDSAINFSATAKLESIDIAEIWGSVYREKSPYAGSVDGIVNIEGNGGNFVDWMVSADIEGRGLRYADRAIPDLTLAAGVREGAVDFLLVHGEDSITADLQLFTDSLQGRYRISVPDVTALARFADQPELSGRVWGEGTVGGAYTNPIVSARVNSSRLSYQNFPVDTLFAEVVFQDSSLTVIDFRCEGKLDSIDPQRPPFGLDSLTGSGSYSCQFRGGMDSLSGSLSVRSDRPGFGSYEVDSISLAAAAEGPKLEIKELSVNRGELAARLQARYDTTISEGSFEFTLIPVPHEDDSLSGLPQDSTFRARELLGAIAGDFRLNADSTIAANIRGRELWLGLPGQFMDDVPAVGGDVDFLCSIQGALSAPEGTLQATGRKVKLASYEIDSVVTGVAVSSKALVLDSLVSYAHGQSLQAAGQIELGVSPEGAYQVSDSASFSGRLSTTGLDVSILEAMLPVGGEISGKASAYIELRGTLDQPHLDGWLEVGGGRLKLGEEALPAEDIALAVKFADSVFTIDSAAATVSGTKVTAGGSLTLSQFERATVSLEMNVGALGRLNFDGTASDSRVDLEILSDSLNLAVLQPFAPMVDSLAGRLGCRLTVTGSTDLPQFKGNLHFDHLSLIAPEQYTRLSGGRIDVSFDENRITVDSAVASVNGGNVRMSGVIEHDRWKLTNLDLALKANGLTVQEPETYTLILDSAALTYGRQGENYVLAGDVVLGETRFTAGLSPTSILPWVQSLETVDRELPELVARSRLNVRIRESDNLWVDNNLAKIRLRTELSVIGTPLRPNFTGMVRIEEGYLLYLDRRFKVNQGTVFFNDPARFNPDINLEANTEVTVYRRTTPETYTIYIRAKGVLDQLEYGLYSEPPLEKPDIVALLTLGATRSELAGDGEGNGQGGLTGVLKDRAAMLTSQRVSGYLSRQAGSLFGFDEFTIQGNLFKFDESWGPQLVASKNISKRINVTYSTTVGHLNDQTVRLGYRLTRRVFLQGETDRQGRAGIDLKYRISFR